MACQLSHADGTPSRMHLRLVHDASNVFVEFFAGSTLYARRGVASGAFAAMMAQVDDTCAGNGLEVTNQHEKIRLHVNIRGCWLTLYAATECLRAEPPVDG